MIASLLMPGFAGTELPEWLEARLRAGLGAVCLFAENIASPEQLRELTAAIHAANPLAIIAIDEEGGDVSRLHAATGSPYPGNAVLGRIDDLALTGSVASAVAAELRAAGVDLDFAPDADINSDPDNPVIGVRSFGTDPQLVARHTAAWVAALQAGGVAASAKHFPGHGDTAADSHRALPVVDLPLPALRDRELVPFQAAIAAGTRTIMSSHILLPQLDPMAPATFSARILQGLLRGELGFDGVIVSDALDMVGASGTIGIPAAAVRAIGGGCDLLCIGTRNTDAQLQEIEDVVRAAVRSGELQESRLADATARVRALAEELAASRQVGPAPAEWVGDAARIRSAFDIREGIPPIPADARILTLETSANIAVGVVPWGLAAAGVAVVEVRDGDALPVDDGRPLVIVGKDIHRHAWTRAYVDRARIERPGVLIVDMGWPGPDRHYADIATFGASRVVAEALNGMREGQAQ
ncbi:beta-N-acetylhexosaminidase [Homoserinibacter sp. GY 40078]|uniref:beta-N-acetylhexosaminidase n=1 Tax=Homoserinibacter sp. GY 40078 TaxID=2603275 RepID=UPI0011CA9A2F|nr:beta-N-acetylhexosaminidase [Homoserinibacter sp. GY 40078]TXK19272.1 beta-N-acetylhexosaminidase [Homoserinibacter sp. GY 40078]